MSLQDFEERAAAAVAHYWHTLAAQRSRQSTGDSDRGARAAVTGGKQMDGFAELMRELLCDNGLPPEAIQRAQGLTLPGWFRPTKQWDMLVIHEGALLAAIEFKSQCGPSFGNNFNNRAEEAIGTTHDLRVATREGVLGEAAPPWLGWLMLLEECPRSLAPVATESPHFPILAPLRDSSYSQRYAHLLRQLVRERLLDSAALVLSPAMPGAEGIYRDGAADLGLRSFAASLAGHVAGRLEARPR